MSKQKKIYYVYAERASEYGRTDLGYFTSKKKAENCVKEYHEKAKRDKVNSEGYKVDGFYLSDFHVSGIEVI